MRFVREVIHPRKRKEHMNRITKRRGYLRNRLRVGVTLAIAAAVTIIAGGKPSEARAADGTTDVTVQVAEGDENLAWSVPTKIPMKATAGGTLIGPGADAIAIRNLSAFPIRVKQMDTAAEAPFNLVDDVDKSSGNNDFMMTVNGTAAKQTVELPDDGTWAMGYTGNEKGSDVLPLTISGAKIARVTTDLSQAKKAAMVTWIVEPTAKDAKQPGTTEPGGGDNVQTAVAKDAKDWTLGEQKAVATDIAKNGTSSVVYAKAKAAMDAGTNFSIKLTNGKTLTYRIIGIDHDNLADGSGKAGLTFESTNDALGTPKMNATDTNVGGWEKSDLRGRLNSGDLWSLLPAELQSNVKPVTKMTNNKGYDGDRTPSDTTDKIFLLSATEVYGDLSTWWSSYSIEGIQYEYYKSKGVTTDNNDGASSVFDCWLRSVSPNDYDHRDFCRIYNFGCLDGDVASSDCYCVFAAFCF